MCIIRLISGILVFLLALSVYIVDTIMQGQGMQRQQSFTAGYEYTHHEYTYHKYNNTDRKYSKTIEYILRNDPDFIEDKSDKMVDWSDKNSKSRIQDYYPFPDISIVDKKYLPILVPDIIPNTYVDGDFEAFVTQSKSNVFFLKPADKYIGNSNGIKISNDPYKLYTNFIKDKYVIQEEVDPLLIDGYKFDIRTYVLIVYNKKYIHIYYNYGIIRYCKEPYEPGSVDPNKQITVFGQFEYVIDNKIICPYLNGIKTIIYQTLYNLEIPDGIGYQYLGYDIMISKSGILYLLEVNIQPSMTRIKFNIDLLQDFTKLVVKPVLTTNKGYKPFMSMTYKNNSNSSMNSNSSNDIIVLAEPNIKHLVELHNITKEYSIMQYIGNLKTWSFNKTRRFIEYGPSDDYYYKAIIISGKVSGIIGIYRNKTTYYNLVIFLGKENIGIGIGNKVLNLFILTVDCTIYADVLNTNTRSLKFFKKLNYSFTVIDKIHRFIIKA